MCDCGWQALWQERCFCEWGEAGWGISCNLVEGTGERKSLGDRVVEKMRERSGLIVDQLTLNKIMDHVLPQRSQQSMSAVEISPFDGLPLDQTISSLSLHNAKEEEGGLEQQRQDTRGAEGGIDWNSLRMAREQRRGGKESSEGDGVEGTSDAMPSRATSEVRSQVRGGSGIDWKRTYGLLATMQATCEISGARTAAAAPASGSAKCRAAMGCLDALAKYGRLRVIQGSSNGEPRPPGAASNAGCGKQAPHRGWQLRVLPTAQGGFRPFALVVSSNHSSGAAAARAASTLKPPKRSGGEGKAYVKASGRLSVPEQKALPSSGTSSMALPFRISVEFPGLPVRVVAEVRGSDGCVEEEVVAVSDGGDRLVTLVVTGNVHEKLPVWVVERPGGRGLRRGGAGGGSTGRGGVRGEILWVGLSLSLSHILTNIHSCPPWAPKCVLPASLNGRGEGSSQGGKHPPVWMRVQIRDAPSGGGGVIWRGGWRNVKGWLDDAIARPQRGDRQLVNYQPQRYASPLCNGPLRVALAQDGGSSACVAGDIVFDDVVWVDFAIGVCSAGVLGAEGPDEWWRSIDSLAPTATAGHAADVAELVWHHSSLCRVEYDSPSQPVWDTATATQKTGHDSAFGGCFGWRESKATLASRAQICLQQTLAAGQASTSLGREDAQSMIMRQSRPWSGSAIHQPAASKAPVQAVQTLEGTRMCEMAVELVADEGSRNSCNGRAWRVESVRCKIPGKL